MYTFFKMAHSGWRYVVFLLLVIAVVAAFANWFGKKDYSNGNRKLNLFAMISAHIQLVLGLVLYFLSDLVQFTSETMKNATLRYWTMEHAVLMLFALVLITVGHSRSKKIKEAYLKHRSIAITYGLALLVIILAIIQSGRPLFGSAA